MLRWGPSDFWASNVWEVVEAWEGYARSKGIKENPKSSLTADDVTELRRMLDAEEAAERMLEVAAQHEHEGIPDGDA